MESDLERVVEVPRQWFEILEDVLRADERYIAFSVPGAGSVLPENLCLWTSFHQRRLIFVPKP